MTSEKIDLAVENAEKHLATLNFLKQEYPDLIVKYYSRNNIVYCSKKVNQTYTNYDFSVGTYYLSVTPYCTFEFEHNGKKITGRVDSSPRVNTLLNKRFDYYTKQAVISFTKLTVNSKNRNMREDFLNDCRVQIMNFVAENPKATLDTTHLDSRLKNLLAFT